MIRVHYTATGEVVAFTETHVLNDLAVLDVPKTDLIDGFDITHYFVDLAGPTLNVKTQSDLDAQELTLLQQRKKVELNAEVKTRIKVGVLSDSDKALSVGLGIYDAAVPGLSQQAKDWAAANIAASNATQLLIFDPAATLQSVAVIDPVADTVWPDVANYPLLMV